MKNFLLSTLKFSKKRIIIFILAACWYQPSIFSQPSVPIFGSKTVQLSSLTSSQLSAYQKLQNTDVYLSSTFIDYNRWLPLSRAGKFC